MPCNVRVGKCFAGRLLLLLVQSTILLLCVCPVDDIQLLHFIWFVIGLYCIYIYFMMGPAVSFLSISFTSIENVCAGNTSQADRTQHTRHKQRLAQNAITNRHQTYTIDFLCLLLAAASSFSFIFFFFWFFILLLLPFASHNLHSALCVL